MPTQNAKRKRFVKWRVDQAIHDAMAIARKRAYRKFEPLLDTVVSRSALLRPTPGGGRAGWVQACRTLRGLLELCKHRRDWLREPVTWCPQQAGYLHEFGSLARHLLAEHAIPNFMTLVWFESCKYAAERNQTLYRHLGRGNSVRGADLPIRLTKSMAKAFMGAPDHYRVNQALRYAQLMGLGADHRLADAIASTWLGNAFDDEAYWQPVFEFLIASPQFPSALVPSAVELFRFTRDRFGELASRQLTSQGVDPFLQRLNCWIEQTPVSNPLSLSWNGCGIRGYYCEEQDRVPAPWSFRWWTIRELTTSTQLKEEGDDLHHCVADYVKACAAGRTSIWSLRSHGALSSHRVLTLQVAPRRRRIITALGECNSRPKPEARRVMESWAEREELEIAAWV